VKRLIHARTQLIFVENSFENSSSLKIPHPYLVKRRFGGSHRFSASKDVESTRGAGRMNGVTNELLERLIAIRRAQLLKEVDFVARASLGQPRDATTSSGAPQPRVAPNAPALPARPRQQQRGPSGSSGTTKRPRDSAPTDAAAKRPVPPVPPPANVEESPLLTGLALDSCLAMLDTPDLFGMFLADSAPDAYMAAPRDDQPQGQYGQQPSEQTSEDDDSSNLCTSPVPRNADGPFGLSSPTPERKHPGEMPGEIGEMPPSQPTLDMNDMDEGSAAAARHKPLANKLSAGPVSGDIAHHGATSFSCIDVLELESALD
jgi:hypothetical protein